MKKKPEQKSGLTVEMIQGGLDEMRAATVHRIERDPAYIRVAKFADVEGILQTLLRALDESETPWPVPEQPYCQQYTMDLIAQNLCFVALAEGTRVVGVIMLDRARWPWTHPNSESGRHLYNQHFWVDPAYRRGGTASKLLQMAAARADAEGLPLLLISSSSSPDVDLADRFFATQGFKRIGGTYFRAAKE